MVSEKVLEGNHNGIAENAIMSVILHLLDGNVTGFDDTRYVLQLGIF